MFSVLSSFSVQWLGTFSPKLGHSPKLLGGPGLLCQQQGGIGRPKYLVFEMYEQNISM